MPQTEAIQIPVETIDKITGSFEDITKELRGLRDEVEKGTETTKKNSMRWTELKSAVDLGWGALQKVGQAAKQAYQFISEGADLELAEMRFDRLSTSIGTTSAALEDDLSRATAGLMSDADQMKLAGDLMSLGLAKTHEEAVRLTSVASQLGMNMNQLVLTLTNQTTMRFDALGVAVDGFDEKVKILEQSGLSANEAFKMAFIEQAEGQIERVGGVAETTAGQLMMLEAEWGNLTNTAKAGAASFAGPVIAALNDSIDAQKLVNEAVAEGAISEARLMEIKEELSRGLITEADLIGEVSRALEYNNQMTDFAAAESENWDHNQSNLNSTIESAASPLSYYAEYVAQATQEQAIYEQHLESTAAAQLFMNDSLTAGGKAYSSISTNVSGFVTSLQEQLDFLTAGGGALLDLAQTAQEALDEGNFAGAQEALDAAAEGAIDLDLELGKITTEQAVEQMMALGNGPEEAKLKVEELENSLFALTSQQHVVYVDLVTRGLVPGGSPSVPGAGAPVVPIEDTGGGGGLVGATAMPGASGSGGTVNWYGDAIFTSSDAALDFISQMQMQSTRSGANSAAGANYVG